jgi:hypothetical protein
MKVYHGSYTEVSVIDLSKCELGKDFGRAFYVTKHREQAEFWAKRKGRIHNCDGFVTEYNFIENAFEHYKLKVLRFDSYSEDWLDFVVANRRPDASFHDYDIIEGPVANDDITQRIFTYLAGEISKTDFLEELKFKHQPSHQIAFCTMASLQMLEWVNRKSDLSMLNIDDFITQSLIKNFDISEKEAIDMYFNSDTYRQLTDEATGLFQQSWEKVYRQLKQEYGKLPYDTNFV